MEHLSNELFDYTTSEYQNYILPSYDSRGPFDSNAMEFWAPITSNAVPNVMPDYYWVSTFGRVWTKRKNRLKAFSMHRKGYYQTHFRSIYGYEVNRKIHIVVMKTFMYFPGCDAFEINHIDGIKTNNHITNLEWCTHSQNTIHAINMGLKTVFGKPYVVRLNDYQVKMIKVLADQRYDEMTIRRVLDIPNEVSHELIRNIMQGRSRKPDSMLN
jgi:hypothetical protein